MKNILLPFFILLIFSACTARTPLLITDNEVKGTKIGKMCGHYVGVALFNIPTLQVWGDEDVYTAATKAGIKRISIVDRQSTSYLIYKKQCIFVYGE